MRNVLIAAAALLSFGYLVGAGDAKAAPCPSLFSGDFARSLESATLAGWGGGHGRSEGQGYGGRQPEAEEEDYTPPKRKKPKYEEEEYTPPKKKSKYEDDDYQPKKKKSQESWGDGGGYGGKQSGENVPDKDPPPKGKPAGGDEEKSAGGGGGGDPTVNCLSNCQFNVCKGQKGKAFGQCLDQCGARCQ